MTIKVAPSILSANFNNLEKEIILIDKAGCDYIHCDIMDGHFVPNISFGSSLVKSIRKITKKILDVHLMINPVKFYIKEFALAGADIITFHIEATKNPLEIIKEIKKYNIKVGLAIKPNTQVDLIQNFIEHVDLILIMTVEPGFGGQKFINSQLSKIKKVKELKEKMLLDIDIEVDGGINDKTGKNCIDAGANVLVAGTYIFEEDESVYDKRIRSLR